ncbi:hypothetical protein PR048_002296 [Dryococelus australis]|uniref:Uncharacterized protein n=1 Tax=Dryococelus australis TaxID=614101 RepID=A0ABQ9ILB2_9NEOP|nr:hypothetical protein PR048_002296 [Dryococelus australis]
MKRPSSIRTPDEAITKNRDEKTTPNVSLKETLEETSEESQHTRQPRPPLIIITNFANFRIIAKKIVSITQEEATLTFTKEGGGGISQTNKQQHLPNRTAKRFYLANFPPLQLTWAEQSNQPKPQALPPVMIQIQKWKRYRRENVPDHVDQEEEEEEESKEEIEVASRMDERENGVDISESEDEADKEKYNTTETIDTNYNR